MRYVAVKVGIDNRLEGVQMIKTFFSFLLALHANIVFAQYDPGSIYTSPWEKQRARMVDEILRRKLQQAQRPPTVTSSKRAPIQTSAFPQIGGRQQSPSSIEPKKDIPAPHSRRSVSKTRSDLK